MGSGIVIGDNATVRAGGGFEESAIAKLSAGTNVVVKQELNGWYQISSDATTGWIFEDLLVIQPENRNSVTKGVVDADNLNVRISPSTEAQRVTQLNRGQEIRVIDNENEWLHVVMSDGQKGWVHGEYIVRIPNLPSGAINKDSSTVYDSKELAQSVKTLQLGDVVYISGYESKAYVIETEDGRIGWIPKDDISLIINGQNPVNRGGFRGNEDEFISITKSYLGSPYKYASAGPSRFDCSGYVYYILNTYYKDELKANGINLPRSSRTMAGVGTPVSRDTLQVGDLVFFNNTSGSINHVGFYIGNNQFIHASSGGSMSVIVSSLNEDNYRRRYNTARRLF
ncbi:C40 family peptidase [Anoxynatronum buryatiense]|uniref:Cell wall-associated hydrolase, NlpC family n=1 Tax=Anoxynatronum buryatiense TaxID=489973 RepID=A0AA46AIH2_9CLOT|nr:C40 family peptidase [Anoxynatronum buryatiense]SMP49832.1 Cell wall-associated hydrolase, NlpC family [Anoxynatronum buryatiense]